MKLTIIDSKSHEPLLVLSEDDRGMNVVGGDPKYVQVLGLQQFSSLKEIADYINSAGSEVQAIFDSPGDVQNPGEENPDMDARIKPALEMIRALMSKVNDRKKREKMEENSKKPETALLNTTPSEIVINAQDTIYVSIDGDNIGNAVARAEEMDDEQTLTDISNRINAGQDVMKDWAVRMGGYVVEQGGDEGVLKVPASAMKEVENLREIYRQAVGATASVGVGKKISESTKSRVVAKLRGKNQTVVYDPSIPQEMELRLKDQDSTEANKLRTAMRPEDSMGQDHPENPRRIDPSVQQAQMPQGEQQPEQAAQAPQEGRHTSEALRQAKKAKVQQKGEPQKKVEKKEQPFKVEGQPVGSVTHDLVKSLLSDKPKKSTGSKYGDPEIDHGDFGEHDDPEFARALMYEIKHGGRFNK